MNSSYYSRSIPEKTEIIVLADIISAFRELAVKAVLFS